jgi:hypothetical protein
MPCFPSQRRTILRLAGGAVKRDSDFTSSTVPSAYLPLVAPLVFEFAVAGRSPETVLFVPGTTVRPVAPGTFGFCAAGLIAGGSAVASPE